MIVSLIFSVVATAFAGGDGNLMKDARSVHRGGAFTVEKSVPLAKAIKASKGAETKTVRVRAKVESVCAKKGCWLILRDGKEAQARITFKGYAFFAPFDCVGAVADVEGELSTRVLSEAERKHYAEDAKKKVSEVPKQEVRLVATALELVRP